MQGQVAIYVGRVNSELPILHELLRLADEAVRAALVKALVHLRRINMKSKTRRMRAYTTGRAGWGTTQRGRGGAGKCYNNTEREFTFSQSPFGGCKEPPGPYLTEELLL